MQSGINALSMEALKTDAFFSIVAQIKKGKKQNEGEWRWWRQTISIKTFLKA